MPRRESIVTAMVSRGPVIEDASLPIPQFFIGHESLKDAWVIEFRTMEKDIGHEHRRGKSSRISNLMTEVV
jgi:hypothetical protein